jgi:hypothetical protein
MKQTATEFLETKIDNELKVIDNLYGKEIIGRKIAFAFVKRILIEAKEIENEQLNQAFQEGGVDAQSNYYHH